jgi:hypothetical protein
MPPPITEKDLQFLIDWYKTRSFFTKHQIVFGLRHWTNQGLVGDYDFGVYTGELDYMPPQEIALHTFPGGLYGSGTEQFRGVGQVYVSFILKSMKMGLWFTVGHTQSPVWEADLFVQDPGFTLPNEHIAFTFSKQGEPEGTWYELYLGKGTKQLWPQSQGPRETPIGRTP